MWGEKTKEIVWLRAENLYLKKLIDFYTKELERIRPTNNPFLPNLISEFEQSALVEVPFEKGEIPDSFWLTPPPEKREPHGPASTE